MGKPFISYSREDKNHPLVVNLLDRLRKARVMPWVDEREIRPGDHFPTKLQLAIQACSVCVFVLTANSEKSRWCAAELGAFWGASKKVLVFQADPAAKISEVAPGLETYQVTESIEKIVTEVVRLCKHVDGAKVGEDQRLVDVSRSEFLDAVRMIFDQKLVSLAETVGRMQDRLSQVAPFDEQSLFGTRYHHFFDEKEAIARLFVTDLESRVQNAYSNGERIVLILDSGTTIFPIFKLLMAKKNDPAWTNTIEIFTNNLPGIFVALRDGRTKEGIRRARLAFRVHVVRGDPNPDYWALLSKDSPNAISDLSEGPIIIGVTTGNYAQDDGQVLFVRDPEHRAFKEALIRRAQVIYSLLPLGKMVPIGAAELNEKLLPSELRSVDECQYRGLALPIDGAKEVVIVTTARRQGDKMYRHHVLVQHNLEKLQADMSSRVRLLTVDTHDFNVGSLSAGSEDREEQLEMPHKEHRPVLKPWFKWGK